jgi:hypothetical protein
MVKSLSADVSYYQWFLWPVGVTLASTEIFRAARGNATPVCILRNGFTFAPNLTTSS